MSPLVSGKIPWVPEKKGLGGGRQHLLSVLVTLPSSPASFSLQCTWGQTATLLLLGSCVGYIAHDMSWYMITFIL